MSEEDAIEEQINLIKDFLKVLVFKLFDSEGQTFLRRVLHGNRAVTNASSQQYCIIVNDATHGDHIRDVVLHFKCTGLLCEKFNAYDLAPEFSLTFFAEDFLDPNLLRVRRFRGFNEKYFADQDSFLRKLTEIHVSLGPKRLEWTVQQFQDFYHEITLPFAVIFLL